MRHRKKIVVLLLTALMGVILLAASRLSVDPAASRLSIGAGLFANDPNFSTKANSNSATQELFLKTMLAVLLVIVIGVAAIVTCRKLLPKIAQGGALDWFSTAFSGTDKKIHILETTHLGPKKAVHLIEIGNQQFLVGSTNESITMLADVTDARCSIPDASQESSIENQESRIENMRI